MTGDSVAPLGAITDRGDGSYFVDFVATAGEESSPGRLQMRFLDDELEIAIPPLLAAGEEWTEQPAEVEPVPEPPRRRRKVSKAR